MDIFPSNLAKIGVIRDENRYDWPNVVLCHFSEIRNIHHLKMD